MGKKIASAATNHRGHLVSFIHMLMSSYVGYKKAAQTEPTVRLHEPDSDCCRYLLVCPQHQHPKQRSYCIRNPVIPVEHAEAGELLEDFDGNRHG